MSQSGCVTDQSLLGSETGVIRCDAGGRGAWERIVGCFDGLKCSLPAITRAAPADTGLCCIVTVCTAVMCPSPSLAHVRLTSCKHFTRLRGCVIVMFSALLLICNICTYNEVLSVQICLLSCISVSLLCYWHSALPSVWTYSVILSILDPRKCEYLKDYSLDFEHAYMTTYLAS